MTTRVIQKGFPSPQVVFTGDHRLRTVGRQASAVVNEVSKHGPVVYPPRTLRDAIGMLGKDGGIVTVLEGIYRFDAALAIARPRVHIRALSPGKTVFKRTKATSDTMLTFSGAECIIEGVRFIDSGSTGFCVEMSEDRAVVRDCFFEEVYAGVKINGANFVTVAGNHFVDADSTNIEFTGTCAHGLIRDNRMEEAREYNILLGTSVSKTLFAGNVFDHTSGHLSTPDANAGMQSPADIATMNVIQSGNIDRS